jgi:DNA-binding MarR family transcriptional regulator
MSGSDPHPDHDPDHPVLLACRALARAINLFDEAACQTLGIGRSDLRALNLLEHGPLSPAVIADQLHLSRSSVTSLLDRLERAGYVIRTDDPADRRGVRVVLRPETFRAFADVYLPLGVRAHTSVEHLSDDDRTSLLRGIEALTTAFQGATHHGS